jgi:hypothetical protein
MSNMNRRGFLQAGLGLAAGAAFGFPDPAGGQTAGKPGGSAGPDGSSDPDPIPWLDKNGSHNQSPGPEMEPSSIFHFRGRVARCNNFTGMGTDNRGNRIAFGAPSTDFSFMAGEYFSGRSARTGAFAHL